MNTKPVTRVAVIGYGGMGRWHTLKVAGIENMEIAGVYDIKPERMGLAREAGLYAYESLEALLADPSVDVVTVATPNHLHREQCIRAMQAGKHVACEKPVAMNSVELQDMIDTANACGVLFTVHQNRRWDEDFLITKKLIRDNTLGPVYRVESRVHGSRGIPGDWRCMKAYGGGMVLDWGVHLLDQALQLDDSPLKSVYARLSYITGSECDDGFTVQLVFESGFEMEVQVGTNNFISQPRWYVLGRDGSATINSFRKNDGSIVTVTNRDNRDAIPVETAAGLTKTMAPRTEETLQTAPLPHVESDVGDFYRNVAAVIRGQAQPIVTHDQVMRVMHLMEAVFRSAQTNRVITDIK